MNIRLCKMTKDLCRRYYSAFEYDPVIFIDLSRFGKYIYSLERSDAYWQRQRDLGRIHFAIMLGDDPIGELLLKSIDPVKYCCTLSVHMQNDSVKNKGYGTTAEILAIEYAYNELRMETIFADALKKNTRSRHVLTKVGFKEINEDDTFVYYRHDKADRIPQRCQLQTDER